MRKVLAAVVILAGILEAKEGRRNHVGQLLSMDSVPCGPVETSTIGNVLFGGAQTPQVQIHEEKLCPEYILQSEGLYYRIRPKDRHHPTLLPIGEQVQFHLRKDHMVLQVEDLGSEEIECSVLSIVPEKHGEAMLQKLAEQRKKTPE
jgi:hypothetical protein